MYFNNVTIFEIYNYLNINDSFSCSLINKQFNNIFNNDMLWAKLIMDTYDNININEIQEQYNITKLKYIYKKIKDLSYLNKIFNLNKTIGSLINLQELSFSNNQLKKISKEIGSLINLKYLRLHNNNLKEIPKELGFLINLKELYLHYNQLKKIPKEIGSLINLQ